MKQDKALIAYTQSALHSIYDGLDAFDPRMEISATFLTEKHGLKYNISVFENLPYFRSSALKYLIDNRLMCNVLPTFSHILDTDDNLVVCTVGLNPENRAIYTGTITDVESAIKAAIANLSRHEAKVIEIDNPFGPFTDTNISYSAIDIIDRLYNQSIEQMEAVLESWSQA